MNSLFVDTSGWASFFTKTEPAYPQAVQILTTAHQQNRRILTSNYILAELVALLDSPLRIPRSHIFTIIDIIKTTSYLDIIYIDAAIDTAAWELCKARPDKNWSLVDCTSFVLMQQQGIRVALTSDHHFEQAGFIRLLKPNET